MLKDVALSYESSKKHITSFHVQKKNQCSADRGAMSYIPFHCLDFENISGYVKLYLFFSYHFCYVSITI